MRIKDITIKNFKCFSNETKIEFGDITLLTGANSSGKSSIMYSLLGLLQSDSSPALFSPNGKYVNMGDYKEIVYNHDLSQNIILHISCEDCDVSLIETEWTFDKSNNQPKLFSIKIEGDVYGIFAKLQADNKYHVSLNYDQKDDEKQELIQTIYDFLFNTIKSKDGDVIQTTFDEFKASQLNAEFILDNLHDLSFNMSDKGVFKLKMLLQSIYVAFSRYKSSINYISSFRLQPERTNIEINQDRFNIDVNGRGYLDQILHWYTYKKKTFNSFKKTLKQIGIIHDIKAKRLPGGRYEINVKTNSSGVFSSLCDVGFGIPQLLPLVVADRQLGSSSTLLVSQPEIHLHPSVQAQLGDYFVEKVSKLNKSYIIETHSEYLLNRIRLNIVKGLISPEQVKVFHVAKVNNTSQVYQLKFTSDGQILNAPKDFFETYMLDVMNIALESTK